MYCYLYLYYPKDGINVVNHRTHPVNKLIKRNNKVRNFICQSKKMKYIKLKKGCRL